MKAARWLALAGAAALGGCASLTTVDKTPDRKTAAALLAAAFTCREAPDKDPCDPGEQPANVRLTRLDCEALPLRSGVREAARARCGYEGEVRRVNGRVDPLAPAQADFSLVELTPGLYIPTREWALDKPR